MKKFDDELIRLIADLYLTPTMTWKQVKQQLNTIECNISIRTLKRRVAPLIKPPPGHARCPCCKRVYESLGVRKLCDACAPIFIPFQHRPTMRLHQ
jgi:hypothetical protein